jgi:2OG-Fe(II) oxygenase superfamily
VAPAGPSLFGAPVPDGFHYRPDFISVAAEMSLATDLASLTFSDFEMRGVIAKRRVAFFGESYDRESAGALPGFLLPLRKAVAAWARVAPEDFAMALVNEYRPGAPIGWHRDAPQYGIVAGISMLASCRMKFRPYLRPGQPSPSAAPRRATHEITLEPRSAYLMTGKSRAAYEHHIPAVTEFRYSITFRTLRAQPRR